MIAAHEPLRDCRRSLIKIEVRRPSLAEQDARWRVALQPLAAELNGSIEQIASQFDFDTQSIGAAGAEFSALCPSEGIEAGARLWEICRRQSRRRLDGLAERIESAPCGMTSSSLNRNAKFCARSRSTCVTERRFTNAGAFQERVGAAWESARSFPARAALEKRWPQKC